MNELYALMGQGLRADEIDCYFDQRGRVYEERKIKGEESERLAQLSISELPYVSNVLIVSSERRHDQNFKDLQVWFSGIQFGQHFQSDLLIPHASVWVQVKSSDHGVEEFLWKVGDRFELSHDDVWLWMREYRYCVVNALQSSEQLKNTFEAQLVAMNTYWTQRPHRQKISRNQG